MSGERGTDRFQRLLYGPRLVFGAAPGWSVANLATSVVGALLPLGGLYLTKLLVDAVGDGGQVGRIPWLVAGIATTVFLAAALKAFGGLASEAVADRTSDQVLTQLHVQSNALDLEFYEQTEFHESLHRAQREAPFRPAKLVAGLSDFTVAAVGGAGVLILLGTAHPLIPIALVAVAVPFLAIRTRFTGHLYRWSEATVERERRSLYLDRLLIDPDAAKEARVFGFGPPIAARFRALRRQLRAERLALLSRRARAEGIVQLLPGLVLFACLLALANLTVADAMTLGDFVMYTGALHRGQTFATGLSSALARLHEDVRFLNTVHQFLSLKPRVVAEAPEIPVPTTVSDGWELHDVRFRYPGQRSWSLRGASFRVAPGEMVALVGTNGSGKTTLIKLLLRLYDPDDGRLVLDGVDVRHMDPAAYRKKTAAVFQDFMRFQLTLSDNVWLGDPGQPFAPDRALDAADAAGASSLVAKLGDGNLDAAWGQTLGTWFDGSRDLSLGEWQKVALARALYSDASLLILDEPTSSMDAEAEIGVFHALRAASDRRATVVVSHRFSTVSMADRIYVMDDGRLIEQGDHRTLVAAGGLYARMFTAQAAAYYEEQAVPPSRP